MGLLKSLLRKENRWIHLYATNRRRRSGRFHTADLWQTPNGLCFLVDHGGARRLDNDEADLILTAPPGVEIHTSPARLVVEESVWPT